MKKGFTLIELLAVIVILAIIALIATPIVLNIIDETKENAVKRSAEMYLNAVEYAGGISTANYYITEEGNLCEQELVNNKCSVEEIEIKVKGEKPTSGKIEIKGMKINTAEVVLSEKTIQKTEEGKIVLKQESESTKSICTLASDSEKTGTELGAKYECEVKPGTKYTFFVLSNNEEDGSTNLIMDKNVYYLSETDKGVADENLRSGFVLWISEGEYGCDQNYEMMCSLNNKGPITAMKYLYNATKDWINVPPLNYTYYDRQSQGITDQTNGYESFTSENGIGKINGEQFTGNELLRTRMPIVSEIQGGHNYLYENLSANSDDGVGIPGYWSLSSSGINGAIYMLYTGSVYSLYVGDWASYATDSEFGVRPVINVKL